MCFFAEDFKILRTLAFPCFPWCQFVYTHKAGRKPALLQKWQSSEKSQSLKEKTQYLMNTLYLPDFQDPPPDIYPSISNGPYPTFRSAISDIFFQMSLSRRCFEFEVECCYFSKQLMYMYILCVMFSKWKQYWTIKKKIWRIWIYIPFLFLSF